MNLRKAVASACLIACVVLISACGRRDVTVNTPEGQVSVTTSGTGASVVIKGPKGEVVTTDTTGGKIVFKSKEGEFVANAGGFVTLPKDFPKDAPIYPATKVMQSLVVPGGHHVVLTTPDSAKKVWDFYADKLVKDGWKLEAQLQTGEGGTLSAKKDNRTCAAIIAGGEGTTTIQLTVVVE